MILGMMIDVVVWETDPGLCMPWQHCFLCSDIGPGVCFGHSGPQPIITLNFISFCELIPGSGFLWHPAR
jgi:hypothetical protein